MSVRAIPALFAALLAVIALISCPMPTAAGSGDSPGTPPDEPVVRKPTLENDPERGLVVYVSGTGERFDVVSEESDGSSSVCVEAFALAPAPSDAVDAAAPAPAADRGIVFGRRSDGSAGIWVILADGTVTGAGFDDAEAASSALPGCPDREGFVDSRFGWTYHVTGWATDGTRTIAVGYVENVPGFHRGPWSVEPGTTLGVYWWVLRRPRDHRVIVTRARVIGTPEFDAHRPPHGRWIPEHMWRRLRGLKRFLAGLYDAYLTMVDDNGASWDPARQVFVVKGTDQDDQRATATVDWKNRITITPDAPTTDKPDLSISVVSAPGGPVRIQDSWPLGATVANLGDGDVSDTLVSFRLSHDATLDPSDLSIGEASTGPILVGTSVVVSCPTLVSINEPGTHWVFAVADPGNAVAELREDNNQLGIPVPVRYPRLVIDTYPATTGPSSVKTFLSLFDNAGDPTHDVNPTLWNNDTAPWSVDSGAAIAEAFGGNRLDGRYARIDYDRPEEGLAPGTYYVRARALLSTLSGPYAIRVQLTLDEDYTGWQFGGYNTTDSPYEPDSTPQSGGVPTRPVTITAGAASGLNRYITAGDVDWFVLVLP